MKSEVNWESSQPLGEDTCFVLDDGLNWSPQFYPQGYPQVPLEASHPTPPIPGQIVPSDFSGFSFPEPFHGGLPTPTLVGDFGGADDHAGSLMGPPSMQSPGYPIIGGRGTGAGETAVLNHHQSSQSLAVPTYFISPFQGTPYKHHGQLPQAVRGSDHSPISKPDQPTTSRKRTTAEQSAILEAGFQQCPKPDKEFREELSRKTNLPTRNIKIWFQNRRAKARNNKETEILRKLADHKTAGYSSSNTDSKKPPSQPQTIQNGATYHHQLTHVPAIGTVPAGSYHHDCNVARSANQLHNPKICIEQSHLSTNIVCQVVQVPPAYGQVHSGGTRHHFYQTSPGYVANNLMEYDTPLASDSEFTDDQGLLTPMSSLRPSDSPPFAGSFREKRTPATELMIPEPSPLSGEFNNSSNVNKRARIAASQINISSSRRYSVVSESGMHSATDMFFSPVDSASALSWNTSMVPTEAMTAAQLCRSRSVSGLGRYPAGFGEYDVLGVVPPPPSTEGPWQQHLQSPIEDNWEVSMPIREEDEGRFEQSLIGE